MNRYIAKLKTLYQKGADNQSILKGQKAIIQIAFFLLVCIFLALGIFVNKSSYKDEKVNADNSLSIDLPDKGLNTEEHWREHLSNQRVKDKKEFDQRLKQLEEDQKQIQREYEQRIEKELSDSGAKLQLARQELVNASLEIKRQEQEKRALAASMPKHQEPSLNVQEFTKEIVYDQPKSMKNYIPEGTYFTGHLLGGIVVSTAMNTPDENATPVIIQLDARNNIRNQSTTNMARQNKLNLGKCRILGSSYGDISSERAIIRLEKLICEQNGSYITSKIAGQLHGPDGYNGIKGTVVSTNAKHIKNALIGGLISGVAGSAKGQAAVSMSGSGIITSPQKSVGDLLTSGAQQGATSAAEKVADYYLRQAEAMSPVLTVPSGVRVNAQITQGFFVGEVSTHKRIKQAKQ